MPRVRRAVLPVPMPRITRPGARALIEAIEDAVSGAIREAGLVTPGPSLIDLVLSAHRARAAYTSLVSIWESYSQACENPRRSARTTSL